MGTQNNNPVRVCLSCGTLDSGGIGIVMINLASALIDLYEEVQVDFLFTGAAHFGRDGRIPPKANVVHLGNRTRYALTAAVRYFREKRPSLIITARSHVSLLMLAALFLSGQFRQACLVFTVHTVISRHLKHSSLRGRLNNWLFVRSLAFSNHVVAVSQGVARDLEEVANLPQGYIKVIYNPAWCPVMDEATKDACPEPWLNEKTVPVIVSAGRLTAAKSFPTLLRAFAELRSRLPVRLIILGEGEQRRQIETLAEELSLSEHLRLPGHVPNPLAYLSKADVFALSSIWEGFGNVVVEALGCGLPIVATDCPSGPREILDNGRYGELVPPEDVVALADALQRALETQVSPEVQRARATDFSFERSAKEYMGLLWHNR